MRNKAFAVLLITFNRLEQTKKVFEQIRLIKPSRLYLSSDAPRSYKYKEDVIVAEIRQWLLSSIDWECEVKTKFNTINLGCGRGVSSAISWFFGYEKEGIILEDDCLPDQSFFTFCEEMLKRYRDEKKVMMVSGNSFLKDLSVRESYYFSQYTHMWGWATWSNRWQLYDKETKPWSKILFKAHFRAFSYQERLYWKLCILKTFFKIVSAWDYPWFSIVCNHQGLSIVPKVNLVTNIGFISDSTHTKERNVLINTSLEEIDFPLRHPTSIIENKEYDQIERDLLKYSFSKRFFIWLQKKMSFKK